MEESSQSSQPPRRQPRRLVHCHQPAATPTETEAQLESHLSEQPVHSQPLQNESPPRKPPAHGTVTTGTPIRISAARHSTATSLGLNAVQTTLSEQPRPSATHSRSHVSNVASPPPLKQPEVGGLIDMEMHDAVFLDDDFVEHFLTGNPVKLAQVLDDCKESPWYAGGWSVPQGGPESALYEPIIDILNMIKRAVHVGGQANGNGQTNNGGPTNNDSPLNNGRVTASLSTQFLDCSARTIPADDADSASIKPDIVLFEGEHEHWETIRMAIEVKVDSKQLKEGMKQLSRYARAVYAHQLHRRHLYGLVICGLEATFVRFDRAGILHSPKINMRTSFEVFTKAFASLMMLDRAAEGYDPAFSTAMNESGRLEYCVDLPESAFKAVSEEPSAAGPSRSTGSGGVTGPGPSSRILPTRRFKVIGRLCHRKSIRGRATIVLRIREVEESDEASGDVKGKGKAAVEGNKKKRKVDEIDHPPRLDYILKLIWRDQHRESEGDVMKILQGMFALAQYVWHCDVAVECHCGTGGGCGTCVDETPRPEKLRRSLVMGSSKAARVEGRATKSASSTKDSSSGCVRQHRIYSRIVMSSVGEPLWAASSAAEFLTALLDAILGYWRLVNLGILHRDISGGNVMLLRGAQSYSRREWMEGLNEDVEALKPHFGVMAESESKLRNILNDLKRDPGGMVSDFDLHTKLSSAPRPRPSDTDSATLPSDHSARIPPPLESGMSSTSQNVHNQDSDVPSKKLKTNSSTSVSVTAPTRGKFGDKDWLLARRAERNSRRAPKFDQGRPPVDFRTGTPTFMSVRVLETKPGARYTHSFMDDLESFFWLLVWSVATHLDPEQKAASLEASNALHLLDNDRLEVIANFKKNLLSECSSDEGRAIFDRLESFANKWATNDSVILLVFNMGTYFASTAPSKTNSAHDPCVVFPEIVRLIRDALAL